MAAIFGPRFSTVIGGASGWPSGSKSIMFSGVVSVAIVVAGGAVVYLPYRIILAQGEADQRVVVSLQDTSGNVLTGVTSPTIEASKNGAAYAALNDGAWTEIGQGDYYVTFDNIDSNTLGHLLLRVAKSGAKEIRLLCEVSISPSERRNDYLRTRTLHRSNR